MSTSKHEVYKLDREIVIIQLNRNDEVRKRNEERDNNKPHFFYLALALSFSITVFFGFHFIICLLLILVSYAMDAYNERKNELAKEDIQYK